MRLSRRALFILYLVLPLFPESAFAQTYLYSQLSLALGNNPSAIASGDFNGDGKPDLAISNEADNTVSVILSNANGGFSPRIDYSVGSAPVALVAADFNGDHVPDLAVVNSHDDTVSVLLGSATGVFGSPSIVSTGTTPVCIVAADFNSDGKIDLAVINQADSTVSVFLGNGDGSFGAASTFTVASGATSLLAGDLNNDGAPDLVVSYAQGSISVLLSVGNGSFAVQSLGLPGSAGLAAGDFNDDGNLDLAVPDPLHDQVYVLLGLGNGQFNVTSFLLGSSPISIATKDFNNDGVLDLVVGTVTGPPSNFPNPILLFLGNGDGTFQAPSRTGFAYSAYVLLPLDFNNDNYADLAVLDTVDTADTVVTIFGGDGTGSIGGSRDFALPSSAAIAGSATADFNGDNKSDVAIAQYNQDQQGVSGFISSILGNASSGFQSAVTTQVPAIGISQMVTGDFNGDGKPDIATGSIPATGGISVVLGNGDGTFGSAVANPVTISGLNTQMIIGGDFNNDGLDDLALLSFDSVNGGSPLYVLTSNGDGTFQPHHVYDIPFNALNLAAGDLNRDGKLDIVVADQVSDAVYIFLGNGSGTFSGPTSYSSSPDLTTNCVMIGDFDNDGKVDLVVGADNHILFYAGNGDGTFKAPIRSAITILTIESAIPGDFNGDGKLDLAILGPGAGRTIVLGNGDGTFQSLVPFLPTFHPNARYFPTGDFNNDGTIDFTLFSASTWPGASPQTASVWTSTPVMSFSSSNLRFASQNVGTSSSPVPLRLFNVGNAPLPLANITASGGFAQSNNCPVVLDIGQGCMVNVIFTPASTGLSSSTLTFIDNAKPGMQLIPLSGWSGPADFVMSATSSSASVKAGNSARFVLSLTSGGGFSGSVQLNCSGAPPKTTCTVSKSSAVLSGSSSVTLFVTMGTTAASSSSGWALSRFASSKLIAVFLLPGLLLIQRRRIVRASSVAMIALVLASCGGGNDSGGGGGGGGSTTGTPPGTYNITVTGVSGSLTHSTTLVLTVN